MDAFRQRPVATVDKEECGRRAIDVKMSE